MTYNHEHEHSSPPAPFFNIDTGAPLPICGNQVTTINIVHLNDHFHLIDVDPQPPL